MRSDTVLIFGAGATKACGGPLTNEILPRAFELQEFINREEFLDILDRFLKEMGLTPGEPQPKLSVTRSNMPPTTQVVVLSY